MSAISLERLVNPLPIPFRLAINTTASLGDRIQKCAHPLLGAAVI
jgi:hypothetical protein